MYELSDEKLIYDLSDATNAALKRYLSIFIGHGLDDDFINFEWFPGCEISAEAMEVPARYDDKRNVTVIDPGRVTGSTEKEFLANARLYMAKEAFRAVHAYVAPMQYSEDTKKSRAVKESLAEYFAYLFCLIKELSEPYGVDYGESIKAAARRKSLWEADLPEEFPFAPARHIAACGGGDIEKFCCILRLSRHDMDGAWEELCSEE